MSTTLDYLKQAYEQRQNALNTQFQNTQRLANEQIVQVEQQASGLAQEAWVNKKQQERTLPNVMAHAGLGGQGYTETTANAIGTAYQNAFNQIMSDRQKGIQGINSNLMTAKSNRDAQGMEIDADWARQQAEYFASLNKGGSGGSGGNGSGSDGSDGVVPSSADATVDAIIKEMTTAQSEDYARGNNYPQNTQWIQESIASLLKNKKINQGQAQLILQRVSAYWESLRDRKGGANMVYGSKPNYTPAGVNRPTGQQELLYDYSDIIKLR